MEKQLTKEEREIIIAQGDRIEDILQIPIDKRGALRKAQTIKENS